VLLAVDIGNTNISMGVFKGMRLIKKYTTPTRSKNALALLRGFRGIDDAAICSVVPGATKDLVKCLAGSLGKKPYIIGKDMKVPVKNLYRKPGQVGQDRLVNAFAAIKLYKAPVVAVDFGTAVTFDAVSRKGEYLGGMIMPGLRISIDALADRTALLPQITLRRPKEFIGKDTQSSILSGIVYGFAAITDVLAHRIKDKIGRNALVIGTGGNINLIGRYCKNIDTIDQDLTLKGINLIYRKIKCLK